MLLADIGLRKAIKKEPMDMKTLMETLQTSGLRLTPQRLAICRYLANTDEHPTAQRIYERLRPEYPSLSLATVYNTLETLVHLGVINILGSAGDGAIHYDADTNPHINLACTSCHRVIDLPESRVHNLQQEVAAATGFQVLGARLLYYGICPECQTRLKEG